MVRSWPSVFGLPMSSNATLMYSNSDMRWITEAGSLFAEGTLSKLDSTEEILASVVAPYVAAIKLSQRGRFTHNYRSLLYILSIIISQPCMYQIQIAVA
jgi:hypothetical protein